jgi:putative DNA primase/helicase
MGDRDGNVVNLPVSPDVSPEERRNRIMGEATRLANLAPGEWTIWYKRKAEEFGIEPNILAGLVQAQIKDREQKAAEKLKQDRLQEVRAERLRKTERDQQRERHINDVTKSRAEREREKEEEKEAERQKKEAERKAKEKQKSFGNMLKLPVDRHDGELAKLAKRLCEDLEALHQEFKDFVGIAEGFSISDDDIAPWPEAVDVAALLQAVDDKIGKHVAMQPHQRTAVTLWVAMAWVHNQIATFSPILTVTSPEVGSGKSTLLGTVARLVPKPSLNVESTGPNVYRFVDANKPTLIIDEADDVFTRKSDLKHIINASWTRGTKIPRQVKIDDAWVTVHFDPFCAKVIGLLGRNLPRTLKTRAIEIRMQPPRSDETAKAFEHVDDFEFATLRRQLVRFAADNATTLKNAQPTFPAGMNNRAAMNWKLLLSISELASGAWPERALEAAERLIRSGRQPSDGVRLLAAMRSMFVESGKTEITSEDIVAELCRNPLDIWDSFNKGGKITQRQVAALLDVYGIHPVSLHPTKRKDFSRQGYKFSQFADACARYLPEDPIIQSPTKASSTKPRSAKRTKRKRAAMIG